MPVAGMPQSAREEWLKYWPLVIVATTGFSLSGVSSYSIGLFMEPLSREFGWSRAQISVATLIPAMTIALLSPFVGALIDRFGSRRLAIPSIALTGLSLAAVGLINGSIELWYLVWIVYSLVSLGTKATIWTAAVSNAFEAGRGLALGVALCGGALVQIVAPPLSQALIDNVGWRQAYFWLGLGWATPIFVLAILFMYEPRDRARIRGSDVRQPGAHSPDLPGLSLRQALVNVPLLRIGASTLLTMFVGTGILVHQVPILTAGGLSRGDAALLASLSGAAGIVGKLLTGWMTDRWDASLIGAVSLTIPVISYLVLLEPAQSTAMIVLAMMIIGYTAGTKLQICAYLTSRYSGMRNFGKIFGVMTSLVGIGGGLGSVAAGAVFDRFGNYDLLLFVGIVSSFICGGLLFRLGAYPNWSARPLTA